MSYPRSHTQLNVLFGVLLLVSLPIESSAAGCPQAHCDQANSDFANLLAPTGSPTPPVITWVHGEQAIDLVGALFTGGGCGGWKNLCSRGLSACA